MNNSTLKKIIIVIILAIIALALLFVANRIKSNTPATADPIVTNTIESIKGCYASVTGQDIYSLTITSEDNGQVSGTLDYLNYEKDSSTGTFTGTYQNGMLSGDYVFMSEGVTSTSDKVFKKTEAGFVEGMGEMTENGDRVSFNDTSALVFDGSITFVPVACQ